METDKIPQESLMTQAHPENEPIQKSLLNQKGNFLLILGAVVIILVVLGAGAYVMGQKSKIDKPEKTMQQQSSPTTYAQPTSEPTTKDLIRWTNSDLHNKVLFNDQTGILKLLDATTKTITPLQFNFGQEKSSFNLKVISSDKNKLLGYSSNNWYVTNGIYFKQIDLDKIKKDLIGDFEVVPQGFSTDSMFIILAARDMSTFGNEPCCEGGDYRKSTNKILALNIDTFEVKELYSLYSAQLEVDLYNPSKNLVGFSEFVNQKYRLLNLLTKQPEYIEKTSQGLNYQKQSEYFLARENINNKGRPRSFSIYSVYDTENKLGQVQVDNNASEIFADPVVWSPDYKHFAVWMGDEQSSLNKLRIYRRNGKEVITVQDIFDFDGIFSENGDSFLYGAKRGVTDFGRWRAVMVETEGQELQVDFPDALRMTPIFWFR